jgi:ferric-dicitrate binding protein FerR (iron transport regulator)
MYKQVKEKNLSMEIQRIQALLEKYKNDQLNEKELEELSNGLSKLNEQEKEDLTTTYAPLWEKAKAGELPSTTNEPDWQQLLHTVVNAATTEPTSRVVPLYKRVWLRYAAVFILIAAGAYVWLQQKPTTPATQPTKVSYTPPALIRPGGNKATLTLSNGTSITLDSATEGSLAMQGATQVMKQQDGAIIYKGTATTNGETIYNTISIPKGGQYQLTLSDGTKVWLNSLTSLHYPVSFNGKNRTVTLEGEAYFEVAKDKTKPFLVLYKNMKVEVLGTHFNIMAYEDEATKTTLLEGSVKVGSRQWAVGSGEKAKGKGQKAKVEYEVILKPGEQAILSQSSQTSLPIPVQTVDAEQAIAWKNGFFHFDKADMPTVLREVARWFDLDIVYKGSVSPDLFSGKIQRNLPLQSILNYFKDSNLNFEIQGRTLIVL